MGKKGNWFVAVKKALSAESKEKKHGKSSKSKHICICRTSSSPPEEEAVAAVTGDAKFAETIAVPAEEAKSAETITALKEETKVAETDTISTERKIIDETVAIGGEESKPAETAKMPIEDAKLAEDIRLPLEGTKIAETPSIPIKEAEDEQYKHAYSVAVATAVAVEAPVAAAEVVRQTTSSVPRFSGKFSEDMAAIKIQTFFRGYLARRALRALRGVVRLKALIEGNAVKRQATATLQCVQTLLRVQSQIRSRRLKMTEENQTLQRQLLLKRQRELETLKASIGENWDDSPKSKEQADAKLINRQEAAIRRERALAYAFTHQQQRRNSSKSSFPMFVDPNNPHWGWSWLERWMTARPWENHIATERDHSDTASVRTATRSAGEITKSYARRETSSERPPVAVKPAQPTSGPSTPRSKLASVTGRTRLKSPRSVSGLEDESRSMFNMQSERIRRHSIGGSFNFEDESLASSSAVLCHMQPAHTARARARLSSPLGDKQETVERIPHALTKKRLSFPVADKVHSPTSSVSGRRFSGPPKVGISQKHSDVH